METDHFERNLERYLGRRSPTSRYASFDYCFNYFQAHREAGTLSHLLRGDALQLSCLHLGFYLASWGMLRGSTELIQRSMRTFIPVIEGLVDAPTELWNLDADRYDEAAIADLLRFARRLRPALHEGASDILVTKVMLGTLGCVPAFDTQFKKGFRATTFGATALRQIGRFYADHADLIESGRERTLAFGTGQPTDRRYTRAKVIDMVFFVEGGPGLA